MLGMVDFLKLQALNKQAYRVSISRSQTSLIFAKPFFAFTICDSERFASSVFLCNKDYSLHGWKELQSDLFDFQNCVTILVEDALFAFSENDPRVRVTKYTNLNRMQYLEKTEL